ncbi:hypothetical protein G6F31_021145 [Rhizopus arrhizus]|nr:hypothetical protein G6F31_021145 [Rhizopus arrhizus]
MAPVCAPASTSPNRPATSGSTPHDTWRSIGSGLRRCRIATTATLSAPAQNVARPSGPFSAEVTSSTLPVNRTPSALSRPPSVSGRCSGAATSGWAISCRWTQRSTR